MSIQLVLPKNYVYIEPRKKVFFLGGPVLGGGDWQREAIRLLHQEILDAYIVCPCRYEPNDTLRTLEARGESENEWISRGLPFFARQTHWERYYLNIASKQGCILFWLPQEDRNNPRLPESGPYAQDTYGELGEWRIRMQRDNARVVIGANHWFPGLSTIEANYVAVLGEQFYVRQSLEETVKAAVAVANKK